MPTGVKGATMSDAAQNKKPLPWPARVREFCVAQGSAEIAVAYALASRANKGGRCHPSLTTLAKDARCARSTAQTAINRMIARGEIAVTSYPHKTATRGHQKGNEYQLLFPAYRVQPVPPGSIRLETTCTETQGQPVPESKATCTKIETQPVPPSGTKGKGKLNSEGKPKGSGSASVSGFKPAEENRPVASRTPSRPAPAKPSKQSHQGKDDLPAILDYEDVAIVAEIDPIRAAQAVTEDSDEWSVNGWRKSLREAASVIGEAQAQKVWIECLHRLYGEKKTGEVRNPSAYFNKLFREAIGVARPAPPEPVRMRSERKQSTEGDEPSLATIQNLLDPIARPIPHARQPIDDAEAERRMAVQRAQLEAVIRREKPK